MCLVSLPLQLYELTSLSLCVCGSAINLRLTASHPDSSRSSADELLDGLDKENQILFEVTSHLTLPAAPRVRKSVLFHGKPVLLQFLNTLNESGFELRACIIVFV